MNDLATASEYIEEERRSYSLYVLQSRALPQIADGLKPSGRRALWTARDGKKYKTATLAGAMMSLHPHAEASDAINTLTGPYKNNIPLFKGTGAFGTLLNPGAYGASRYTSITVSKFSQEVIFKDIEIVPMIENYDSSQMEPSHFLPLMPISLLNPTEGIAVGFATNILPRNPLDIIDLQIQILNGVKKPKTQLIPTFLPLENQATVWEDGSAYFVGEFEKTQSNELTITKLPYGITHQKYTEVLNHILENNPSVLDYDDLSKDKIRIQIKLKRGVLNILNDADIINMLKLQQKINENLTLINFDGRSVIQTTAEDVVERFTTWRLGYYPKRYERLIGLAEADIQKYKDILLAIKFDLGAVAKKVRSRVELKMFIGEIGVVNIDYIADLPVYRFTLEEAKKVEKKLSEREADLKNYVEHLNSIELCKKVYKQELVQIRKMILGGQFDESQCSCSTHVRTFLT